MDRDVLFFRAYKITLFEDKNWLFPDPKVRTKHIYRVATIQRSPLDFNWKEVPSANQLLKYQDAVDAVWDSLNFTAIYTMSTHREISFTKDAIAYVKIFTFDHYSDQIILNDDLTEEFTYGELYASAEEDSVTGIQSYFSDGEATKYPCYELGVSNFIMLNRLDDNKDYYFEVESAYMQLCWPSMKKDSFKTTNFKPTDIVELTLPSVHITDPKKYHFDTGTLIQFDCYAENNTDYLWDFGDDNSSTQKSPTHSYTEAGTYDVVVKVWDASTEQLIDSDETKVYISNPANKKPSAHAGANQEVNVNEEVSLHGTGKDSDGSSAIEYIWTRLARSLYAELSDNSIAEPTFTPSEPGDYFFSLQTYDGEDYSDPNVVRIRVSRIDVKNNIPQFKSNPPTSAIQGVLYSYQPVVEDLDGHDLSFSGVKGPITVGEDTGYVTWTPDTGGTVEEVVIRVSDGIDEIDQVWNIVVVASSGDDVYPPSPITRMSWSWTTGFGWDAPVDNDFSHFRLYRSTSEFYDISQADLVQDNIVSLPVTDPDAQIGQSYYYAAVAVDTNGNVDNRVKCIGPITPGFLTIVDLKGRSIYQGVKLEWDASESSSFYAYRIWRSDQRETLDTMNPDGHAEQIDQSIYDKNVTEYVDSGLDPQKTYYYAVTIIDDAANEDRTPTWVGPIRPTATITPVILEMSEVTDSSIIIDWSVCLDSICTGYAVYRKHGMESSWVNIANYATFDNITQHTDSGLLSGETYYYKVHTISTGDDEAISRTISGTVLNPGEVNTPPSITLTAPTDGDTWSGIRAITWDASDADDDPITIEIFYKLTWSSWTKITSDLSNEDGEYIWNTRFSISGNEEGSLIKIIADDGKTTSEHVMSTGFTISNVNPTINKVADLPVSNNSFAAVEIDGNIYILGGDTKTSYLENNNRVSDIYKFNTLNNTFEKIGDLPKKVAGCAAVSYNGKIYSFGGSGELDQGGWGLITDIFMTDISTGNSQKIGDLPETYSACSTVEINDQIFAFCCNNGEQGDILKINPSNGNTIIAGNLPVYYQTGSGINALAYADKIYVIGAFFNNDQDYKDDILEIDSVNFNYVVLGDIPSGIAYPLPTNNTFLVFNNNIFQVFGEVNERHLPSLSYGLVCSLASTQIELVFSPIKVDEKIFVFAGHYNTFDNYGIVDEVYEIDFSIEPPSGEENHSPVVSNVTPSSTSGDIAITYDLADEDDDICSIIVKYQGGSSGTNWSTASTTGTTTSLSPGSDLTITWNSNSDEPDQESDDYKIRITPNDGEIDGTPGESSLFSLDNTGGSGGISIDLVYVEPGTFQMGQSLVEGDEMPVHSVNITQGFYMGKYEVTNTQYIEFLNDVAEVEPGSEEWFDTQAEDSDSHIIETGGNYIVESGYENHPVIQVSWYGAKAFCNWMSSETGENYRFPSEAEWEYACRGGSETAFCYGDTDSSLGDYAWYSLNSGGGTHQVGEKLSNDWGLYDMHGNIWEWCEDDYHDNYTDSPVDESVCVDSPRSTSRVLRGGSWGDTASSCRSARRYSRTPTDKHGRFGFRVVLEAEPVP